MLTRLYFTARFSTAAVGMMRLYRWEATVLSQAKWYSVDALDSMLH